MSKFVYGMGERVYVRTGGDKNEVKECVVASHNFEWRPGEDDPIIHYVDNSGFKFTDEDITDDFLKVFT